MFLGLNDGDVVIYNLNPSDSLLYKIQWFDAHKTAVKGLEVSDNKKLVATCSGDAVSNFKFWLDNTKQGVGFGTKMNYQLYQDITLEGGAVNCIRLSQDLKFAVSGDKSGMV